LATSINPKPFDRITFHFKSETKIGVKPNTFCRGVSKYRISFCYHNICRDQKFSGNVDGTLAIMPPLKSAISCYVPYNELAPVLVDTKSCVCKVLHYPALLQAKSRKFLCMTNFGVSINSLFELIKA